MEPVESIKYKGYDINIYQDENAESPEENRDNGIFLVAYHRDFSVGKIPKKLAQAIATGKDENGEIHLEAKTYIKKYHIFGLEAYIHSGVVLALSYEGNFVDRRWDVSQLGLVFVSKEEAKTRKQARKLALGLIKDWNICLSGQIYGFRIMFGEEEIDSCWGHYGDDFTDMIKECKSTIDYNIKQKAEKNSKKLKSLIKNKVPLENRILEQVN